MKLQRVTNPIALPLSMNSMKDHLRIERSETAYDDDLNDLIVAAAEFIRAKCHVELINTQYRALWNQFPACRTIKIPLWPVVTVDSITYYDTAGALQTMSASLYQTELIQSPATVTLAPLGTSWPSTQDEKINAVILTFTTGFGIDSAAVPAGYRHAMKLLVAHWFRNRESVLIGSISKELEFSLESLIMLNRENEFEEFLVQ